MKLEEFYSILRDAVQSCEWVAYTNPHGDGAIRLSQWNPHYDPPTWKCGFSPLESFNEFCPITAVENILHDRVFPIDAFHQCRTAADLGPDAGWVVAAADRSSPTAYVDPEKFERFRKGLMEACGLASMSERK